MAMNDEGLGGVINLYAYLDKDTNKHTFKSREEAEDDNAYIDAEYKYLSRYGMAPGQGNAKNAEEQAFWDKYQRLRGDELAARSRDLAVKMRKNVPATVFRTADGEEFAVANEDLGAFYKSDRYKQLVKSGLNPEQVNAYRAKGFMNDKGEKFDAPRDFTGTKSDENVNKILSFMHEKKFGGYLSPKMVRYFNFNTPESIEREEKRNQRRAEEYAWQKKQLGLMDTSEMYGNQVGFGGMSLTQKNKGAGKLKQAHNWFNDNLNFVGSWLDERAQALEMELGSEDGYKELLRRQQAGEPILTDWEKIQLGFWSDDAEETEFLNDPDAVYSVLRERLTNRERAKYEESTRGTTFWADAARATSDSARLMSEMAVINSVSGGFGTAAKFGKVGAVAQGVIGTVGTGALHGDARKRKLMADQVRFDAETGDLKVTSKGAGALEATLKGYGSGALEYIGEQYSNALVWKPLGKLGKKLLPSKMLKFSTDIAEKFGNSTVGKILERVASNPTMDVLHRLSKRTGVDLSLSGFINEAIGEELPANALSGLFNIEGVNEDGDVFHWADAWGGIVDTLKNAPAMAISVGLMGAGTGIATRSAQGVYNYATDRKTIEEALKQFGFRDEHLKNKSKQELNDALYGEMRRRGELVDEGAIDALSDVDLTRRMKQCGLLPDNDTGEGIPIEQKREAYKNFLKMNGSNVVVAKAANAIVKAAARQIMGGMNHANIVERLDADIFTRHSGEFNAAERDQMRQVMALRSMGSSYKYRGNMMGHLMNDFANGIYEQLSDDAKAALAEFQSQYTAGSTPVPGTADAKNFSYEKSTFKHPVSKRDWDNNPKGGYVDFGTGIALRPNVDEDGNADGWRVDVEEATAGVRGSRMALDEELIRYGLNPRMGLPYGVKSTAFKTLAEARQFADNLSAWQNTEKKRLLSKAKAAEMYYQRIRGEEGNGLVLLRSPHDAKEDIKDEIMDATIRMGAVNPYAKFGTHRGFFSLQDGKMYVFLDNVSSPYDLLQTIQHEGAHQGFLDTFGGDIQAKQAFFEELAKDGDLPAWMKEALKNSNRKAIDLEEFLAEVAESVDAGPTLFNKVSKALRNATARVNGVGMNESDVQSMIFDAYKAKRIDPSQVKGTYVPTGSYSTVKMAQPVETKQTAPAAQSAPNDTEKTTQSAPNQGVQAPQSAPTQTAQPAPTAEPTTATGKRAANVVRGNEDLFDDEEGEAEPEAPKPVEGEERTESGRYIINTDDAPQGEAQKPEEPKPVETAKPNEPQAEAPKPAEEKPVEQKAEAQEDAVEVLNIGSVNYIDDNTFSRTGDLYMLNGIDDITTQESQDKIYDRLPYAVAIGARVANLFRSSGFAETAETARLRHDFQAYFEVVEDLPDSQQKRIAIKNLSASWHAMEREIENLKNIDKPKAQQAKQEKSARKSKDEVSRLFGDPLGAVFRDWSKANGVTHSNKAPKGVQFPSSTQVNGKTKLYYTAKSEGETGEQYIRENVAVSIDGDTAHFKVTRNGPKGSGDTEKSTNYFSIPLNAELFSHPMNIGGSYNNIIGRGFSDSYPLGRAFDDALRGVMKQVREVNIQPRETRIAQKPVAQKQEQPKQEVVETAPIQQEPVDAEAAAIARELAELAGLLREDRAMNAGLLREGEPVNQEEFNHKAGTIVGKLATLHISRGGRTFNGFAAFAYKTFKTINGLWDFAKKYLKPQWDLAAETNPDLDEVTRAEAKRIIETLESGTIEDNNTQNKEQDDGRSVNSSQNVSPDNGVGSGPSKSGEVQSQRTDGADGSVGNRVSRGGNADLRGPESHEDVVPGESASPDEDSVGRTGGRDSTSGDGGRGSGGQTTSVPEVGSSTGERVVSESSTESGDSASDERGERGPAKSTQKVEGGKDSLLKAKNYRIPADGGQIGKLKNERARVQANLIALTILKQITEENRPAKASEQENLALYSGWGGLSSLFNEDNKDWTGEREALRELLTPREYEMAQRSVQYAHYTPIPVVMGMYAALERLGVKGAGTRMFEAGAGVGHFIGSRPDGLRSAPYIGIEIDPVSARIAKALYPKADIEQVGFQDFVLPANSQDVVIGNPPFSDIKLTDTTFPESRGMSMHNHFIAKQINALRPGGIGVFIVSRYFMDGQNTLTREYIAKQADLVGAIRLPNGVFGRIANTDVVTDIVVFRKRMPGEAKPARNSEAGMWVDTALEYEYDPDGKKEKGKSRLATPVNKYFANSQHVAGRMTVVKDSQYNRPTIEVQNWQVDSREADFNEKVERYIIRPLLEQLPENIYKPERNPSPQKRKQEDEAKALEAGKKVADGINHPALMEGGYYLGEDGSLYVLSKDEWGARKGVKVQNYDEKAEKAAYEKRVKEQKALNPKFNGKKFDRFESVPDSNAKFTPKEQAFIKDYVHLRNVRYDLIAFERSATATDEQIEAKRKELNEAYEACKKSLTAIEKPQGEFSLNTARVLDLIGSDPASAQVRGLEEFKRERDVNDEGVEVGRYKFKNVKKAAIFNRRVYTPAVSEEQHFDNVKDAYIAGINLTGKVNLSWISKVTGLDEEAVEKDLLESGLAFYDPSAGEWKHSAAYLSGDVKTKLAEAKQALKDGDKRMEANVKALEAVQPEYLPSNKITITFGSPVLEQEDVSSFISETLGIDVNSVSYSPVTGLWDISLEEPRGNAELKKNFPTAGLSYHKILNAAINNKSVTVKNSETEQVDQAATELANQTVKNIRNLWESWWQSDSDIAEGITERFNERYNRYAEAKYDGSVLTFEGLAGNLTPYKHQRDAVMRTILTGNILYNHVVGSGKTNTAILSIMEMRRMGLVKKPCIIVPNSLTQQWRSEILSAYPGANVLAPLSEEFEASERKRLLARIQNGDWDVVVIPHSQLSKISLQPSVMQQFYEAEAAELRAALSNMKKGARGRSRIEKRVQALEERIKRNMESLSKDNTGMFFDTLGIDGIFVDEAHEFKNVPYASSRQVSGMGNAQGSAKALDLLTKVQWMRSAMPESPISFLTGTPVSNSLVEFYLNMRYMAPDLLRDAGIHNLDSFLEQFVDVTREYEITPAGTYKEKERVRNLKNIGALMMMVRSYMDVVDSDDLKVSMKAVGKAIDIPELESGAPINVVAKRSPEQRAYFGIPLNRYQTADGNCTAVFEGDTIIGRAEAIAKGGVDPSEDNMLKVVGDSMKASLDFRLVDPNAPDFAGSKVNLCVNNVLDTYHKFDDVKGTQIIFCDRGIPNSGKGEVKKELQKLKDDLEEVNRKYQNAINKGKTDEEIATDVDEDGESLIDKRERLSAAVIEREGELNSSFSVYDDIKQKLIQQGIPAEQIAFIHDYPKDHQKKRLFEKVNTGEVRVLIGSTAKMGTGVNVQKRICSVHHLDVPWRPADLTQRNGRAIRQGNLLRKADPNFKIKVMYYATERTSDAFRWQTVESKAKGIDMVYKAGLTMNVVEDISEDAVSSEEMKAQSVGSKIHPRSAELNKKMREMNEQRSTFYANRNATVETIKTSTVGIQQLERGLARVKVVRDTVRPLERPKGNFYHDIELVDRFNGKVTTFEPQTSFNAREKAEGKDFEPIAKKLIMGQMLRHRGFVFSRDPNSHISQFLNGYLTEADAKAGRNAVLYSVASLSPNTPDGILFSAITKELNLASERVERMEEAIAAQRKTLANAEARLAEMPEKFEMPAEFSTVEQEANDIEFVKARNAMTGQEAHYALSVKYGKEGKPVPQYDWADPTDYGEEGVPTPVIDAGGNAGLLREGMPKGLSPRERRVFWEQYNEKEALKYKRNANIPNRGVINTFDHALTYDYTNEDNLVPEEMWNIDEKRGKLSKHQKEFNDEFNKPAEESNSWNEKRRSRQGYNIQHNGKNASGDATASDGGLDGVAHRNLRGLSEAESLPQSPQDNPTGYSDGSGVGKDAGLLREAAPLDEHLQARRDAMPKMGLEAARANVQAALHREAGESRKAWGKRKAKAIGAFVSRKLVDARRPLIDAVRDIAGDVKLSDDVDIATAMQLAPGRIMVEHQKIDADYINPVIEILVANNVAVEQLDTYLTAIYAPERNKMIFERTDTKKHPGSLSGSGITNEEAAKRLDELRDMLSAEQFYAMERAAEMVWKMNWETLERLSDAGVLAREQVQEWRKLSPHYVPLRDDLEKMGLQDGELTSIVGQPFMRAVGRFTETNTSQLGWSILQAKQAVLWAEQNLVNNVALNFCRTYESKDDYVVSAVPARALKVFQERKGFRMEDAIPLNENVDTEHEAIARFKAGGFTIVPDPKQAGVFWVDSTELDRVLRVKSAVDKVRTAQRHNVIAKVNGKRVYILFNRKDGTRGNRMGRAISRANIAHPDNWFWNTYAKMMRVKTALTTTLSPTFAVRNLIRDLVNTTGIMMVEGKGAILKKVYKNYASSLKEMYNWRKKGKFSETDLGKYCQEAIDNGILTGTWATASHENTMIDSVLEPILAAKQRAKFGKEVGATIGTAYRSTKNFLELFSSVPEVGIRLAVYAAMRDSGVSMNDATVYAREITVDFNKKGELTPVTNILYMFSNANIQAFNRWTQAVYKDGQFNTKGALLGATTFFLIGFMNKMIVAALAGLADDDEDEEWKNIPNYAWERGLPILLGDHYVDIPLSGLPTALTYLGSRMYDVFFDPTTSVADAFIDTAKGPLLDSGNFVNGSGSIWQYLSPTLLDPIVQISRNESWTGAPLHAEDYGNDTTPRAYLGRKQTTAWAKGLAKALNAVSGGNDVEAGYIDVYPETIAMIGQFFTGQLGTEVAGVGSLLSGDIQAKNVPIVKGVFRKIPDNTYRYYERATEFNAAYRHWKEYVKDNRVDKAQDLIERKPFLRKLGALNEIDKRIRRLTREINRLSARGLDTEVLNQNRERLREMFIEAYEEGYRLK